jgi:glutathione synthase/RimK-type ligase-like ATP-grasp enzyme
VSGSLDPARPVVVIGPAADRHVEAIAARVRAAGAPLVVLDPEHFPQRWRLTLGEQLVDVAVDGRPLTPAAVYVRRLHPSPTPFRSRSALTADQYRRLVTTTRERFDVMMALLARWEVAGIPIYNGILASHRVTKPFQLALLAARGLPVPTTRWTNDPAEVHRLAGRGRVAYKPVAGGAATRELAPATDLAPDRLSALRVAPATFQELLAGEELRVYVLDGVVIAAIRITSRCVDYRQHEDAIDAVALPAELAVQCRLAADVVGLRFTGMDLKRDHAGVARFLELNPSPMFLGFDARAGTDIAGRLAARLVAHAEA